VRGKAAAGGRCAQGGDRWAAVLPVLAVE